MSELTRDEMTFTLIDILRKNFLYQTPRGGKGGVGVGIVLSMRPRSYDLMMKIIHELGGWDLSEDQRGDIVDRHESVAKKMMIGNFNGASLGDLMQVIKDADGIPELIDVAKLAKNEINRREGR